MTYPTGPQPYPQPFQPQQPPQRKKRVWPWILIGAVILLCGGCFGLLGVAANEASDSDATFTSAANPEPGKPGEHAGQDSDTAPAGASVRDGKFEFTVTAVDPPVSTIGDNPYMRKTAQGEYILVHVTVTNIGDRPQTYFSSNQKLFDDHGRRYENDTMAELNVNDNLSTPINPGNSVDVTIVFDVPVGTVPASLELHDSMFSGGAKVALR